MEIIKHEDGTYTISKMDKEAYASLVAVLGNTNDNFIYDNIDMSREELTPLCKEAYHMYLGLVNVVPHKTFDSHETIIRKILEKGEQK